MSMGASGTWHLGLKHPDRFVALGPYCGYVDTYQFSKTPLKNFVKVENLPPHQERTLHMLDSIDYAANAGVVPAIACMGEKDVFFDAHVLMGKAMEKEGLTMVNLISPGTGHTIDPVTHKEQMKRIAEIAVKGLGRPAHVRFATWTLKYPECHWLKITGLKEHYARAEIDATQAEDGLVEIKEPKNIRSFSINGTLTPRRVSGVRIAGKEVPLRKGRDTQVPLMFLRMDDGWEHAGFYWPGKTPGLQGPIDDAFASAFLCVRGTGTPWNKDVHAWSEANLKRFAYEWHRYFRGELPVKDEKDVTDRDLHQYNLILFGDPGSNAWIGKVLPKLPLEWTKEEVRLGDLRYSADKHVPVLIHPNPLPGAAGRYVVLNSGHTFHEKELASINYLLFPRLGDWAVLKVGGKIPQKPSEPLEEEVLKAGFFDEEWKAPK
jgi:hypothetical protein